MEENRTWEADNYWIELLKKYNRSKLEELRKEKAGKNGAIVLDPTDTSTPARLYENISSTEILEQQLTLERQITSMADMLVLLDRENPDFIGEIISCEKGEKIRKEQENHSLSRCTRKNTPLNPKNIPLYQSADSLDLGNGRYGNTGKSG